MATSTVTTIRFKPRLIPTLAFLAVLPVLIGLGLWQLDRADQKRALQSLYDQRMADAPITLGAEPVAPEAARYYRAEVRGSYEAEREILLDNRVHEGRAGFHVITPFRIDGTDTRVLVNRGWVPLGATRAEMPLTPPPGGIQKITGIVTVPNPNVFRLGPPPPLDRGWVRVWQHVDLARFAAAVTYPVQPVVILLDKESSGGGFVRDWKRLDTGIAVHEGYAFQWFSLALALATIFLFLSLTRQGAREANDNHLSG
jgi:surfeit locus 1 family protein